MERQNVRALSSDSRDRHAADDCATGSSYVVSPGNRQRQGTHESGCCDIHASTYPIEPGWTHGASALQVHWGTIDTGVAGSAESSEYRCWVSRVASEHSGLQVHS